MRRWNYALGVVSAAAAAVPSECWTVLWPVASVGLQSLKWNLTRAEGIHQTRTHGQRRVCVASHGTKQEHMLPSSAICSYINFQWLKFVESQVFSLAYVTVLAEVSHLLYMEKQQSLECPLDAYMYVVPWIVALYSISSPAHESLHNPCQPSQEIQGVTCIYRRCTKEDHHWWMCIIKQVLYSRCPFLKQSDGAEVTVALFARHYSHAHVEFAIYRQHSHPATHATWHCKQRTFHVLYARVMAG